MFIRAFGKLGLFCIKQGLICSEFLTNVERVVRIAYSAIQMVRILRAQVWASVVMRNSICYLLLSIIPYLVLNVKQHFREIKN